MRESEVEVAVTQAVLKLRKYTHTLFSQKFREDNVCTKLSSKELISRNFFGEIEFLVFPHCG